ncbi:MAG: RHS repeat-associated core domain-containing protein [Lachnospiraceae bacterium]|nr:RHS repeat-associated core domain-containing protein [Lachnospiraceae bacterium]
MTGTQGNTIGAINPFRYRGYYWDEESWLYYLNSRYYDAVTGRFLNADNCVSTGGGVLGYNMFAYCYNNPVMLSDSAGNWPKWLEAAVKTVKKVATNVVKKGVTFAIKSAVYSSPAANVVRSIVNVVKITSVINKEINMINEANIRPSIKPEYKTKEEVLEAVKTVTDKYDNVRANFTDSGLRITNSYKINNRVDRQKISMIYANSPFTDRSYSNISAEWLGHNIVYSCLEPFKDAHIGWIDSLVDRTVNVDLDYIRDSHDSINVITKVMEVYGWE